MVSDYDSDSSDDDSIDDCHGTQTPKPTAQSPRVSTFTSAPAFNTRSKQRSITQETILHNINFAANPFTPQKAAHRNYPFGVLNAVLDKESGELMEYKHLVANPKYRTIWTQAYGKELGRLAQGLPNIVDGTDTIKFIHKHDVPTERCKKMSPTADLSPASDLKRRIHIEYDLLSVEIVSTSQVTAAPLQ